MTHEESMTLANAMLAVAGWTPIANPVWAGGYCAGRLVGGVAPNGTQYVKALDAVLPSDPRYGPDTPDEPHEAAAWLIVHARARMKTETAHVDENDVAADVPVGDSADRGGGELEDQSRLGADLDAGGSGGGGDDASGRWANGSAPPQSGDGQAGDAYDFADFGECDDAGSGFPELGAELLESDFAASSPSGTDHFIGLDDLDRVQRLRIGDVAAAAAVRIVAVETAVGEREGEYAGIQAYVVSNLDKHTGAFTPQDDAGRATYDRFLALEAAKRRIAAIDARRKEATAFLLQASRDDVLAFDPEAGWP